MSQAFLTFKEITPEHVKSFSLQEALKNVGLSQGMSVQQLLHCKWQVSLLKQRIDLLQRQNAIERLKKQSEIDRLKRQYELLQALQQIAELQERNKNLQEIIGEFQAKAQRTPAITGREQAITGREQAITRREQGITRREQGITRREQGIAQREQTINRREPAITGREQAITGREQGITRREQAITGREQTIAQREQTIAQREQAIKRQETPFYLKWQFLIGYFLALIGIGISVALGWKGSGEPGYNGFFAGVIIGAAYLLSWIALLLWKGWIEYEARKAKKERKVNIKQRAQESSNAFRPQGSNL